ncbi:hypothetical protein IGI04_030073 [Brassica rapa subsp. trilocularis]|uniref:Uncharacterized protein n=1 Tax=Brassica rapa subsp. trilocularis TaxID=1813537 RepID=A0ABQ7LPM5_BRACM|nr:hypothetical protein IGI04_030073 [Brassica rapa subsp. trilocularis]
MVKPDLHSDSKHHKEKGGTSSVTPRGTCNIAITTRQFRCDKSGSVRRTTLGYNGWERTTSTAMIGGSFIKENMVRPKDSEDEDMFGAE